MNQFNNKKIISNELEKLGYWKKMYSVPNVFGTGETKFAQLAFEKMQEYNVKSILELGCGQGRDSIFLPIKNFT